MLPEFDKIKGIHPGYILKRELEIRGLNGSELASIIDEHKQTINAIIKRRRKITPRLSIKLSKTFNVSEDYFMLLQASYEVKTMASSISNEVKPNLKKFRQILFWDTDIHTLNWSKQKRAIIKRVLERGNDTEITELINYYGKENISIEIKQIHNIRLKRYEENITNFKL